jgi:soluble lytic murein transglycosylase-like protein
MKMLFFPKPHSALSVLLLAIAPALHAGESSTVLRASPYRLVSSTDSGSPLNVATAPYQLDQRYRLEQASSMKFADKPYARQINAAAQDAGLDPALVHAVIAVESAYQSSAVSPKGAVGLMQVMPDTALRYGVTDPANVNNNLRAGTRHLRGLMDMFDNRVDLVLAAYNAGEGAVKRYNNTIPPYPETRHYVPAVIDKYKAAGGRITHAKRATKPLVVAHNYLAGTRLDPARPSSRTLDHF